MCAGVGGGANHSASTCPPAGPTSATTLTGPTVPAHARARPAEAAGIQQKDPGPTAVLIGAPLVDMGGPTVPPHPAIRPGIQLVHTRARSSLTS